ncbi:putative BYS1 domain protein [Aspergillus lucknowensis]|uniref:BYS1 domain protein n=1 Tax=Aspergillus lucknowensis TaxID=176173 RepID=A0ABR4LKE6_9EURO
MHFSNLALTSLFALAPLTSAVGSANVTNNCLAKMYLWSVGGSISDVHTINPGETFSEQFYRDPVSGGVSLKISRKPDGLYDGSPQLNFAYTLDPSQVWYDLSTVFGSAFKGKILSVASENEDCPTICWPHGEQPAGSQVKTCEPNSDKVLTLCAEECPA